MSAFDYLMVFLASYLQYFVVAVFLILFFSQKKTKVVLEGVLSVILARGIFTEIIRFFYHSPRPYVFMNLQAPFANVNSWSFPSGHAAFFFALATTTYFYNKKLGVAFFVLGILISIGRVYLKVHWATDILGGFLVGIISALLIHKIIKIKNSY